MKKKLADFSNKSFKQFDSTTLIVEIGCTAMDKVKENETKLAAKVNFQN